MNPHAAKATETIREAIRYASASAAKLSAWAEEEEAFADRYGAVLTQASELGEHEDAVPFLDTVLEIANERVRLCEQISADYRIPRPDSSTI